MIDRELCPYDVAWPERFARESPRVAEALHTVAIEHVGSTSVPGMPAKPTIDMAAGVRTLELPKDACARMEAPGYAYGSTHGLPQHIYRRGAGVPWDYLVHVVEHEGQMWRDFLHFREHLRSHPDDAATYARNGWYRGLDKAWFIHRILNSAAA
jgi:GrpB-like predicted nucleotidyltransferase (UPF0157 family)